MSKDNGYIWHCKCDCGNYIDTPLSSLTANKTISCGCVRREQGKRIIKEAQKVHKDKYIVEDTNLFSIQNKQSNNTSGVSGVSYNRNANMWIAYITFKKQRHFLGYFKNKDDAIKARKEAEEKYFKPVLDKYRKEDKNE